MKKKFYSDEYRKEKHSIKACSGCLKIKPISEFSLGYKQCDLCYIRGRKNKVIEKACICSKCGKVKKHDNYKMCGVCRKYFRKKDFKKGSLPKKYIKNLVVQKYKIPTKLIDSDMIQRERDLQIINRKLRDIKNE